MDTLILIYCLSFSVYLIGLRIAILESNNPWLLGKYFSILDIFAFVTLEFADKCQLQPEEELNALEIWLQKMRDSLEATN